MTDWIQKSMIQLNPVKSLLQHHQTRMTHSFPTVLSAPPSESEKCPFNNVNGSRDALRFNFNQTTPPLPRSYRYLVTAEKKQRPCLLSS